MDTCDQEIRRSFHLKRLRHYHDCSDSLVIDELGVDHGKKRVDIAVLNGEIQAFEIKSSRDTLDRLPDQIGAYSKCFERVSIIAAENHLPALLGMLPNWCGVVLVTKGARGGVHFRTFRRSKKNPSVDVAAMAHFLWRKEAIELLHEMGVEFSENKASRKELYEALSARISHKRLSSYIKKAFMRRADWRSVSRQP